MAQKPQPHGLPDDYVHVEYVRAFTSASDRVRYITFIILVLSVLAFGGYRNSHQDSWTNARVNLLRTALDNQLYDPSDETLVELERCESVTARKTTRCRELLSAQQLLEYRRLRDPLQIRERLKLLEEVQINQAYNIHVPFFGVGFDVNDLGMLTGLALLLLTLTHLLAISREHENLHLAVWKVRELCALESSRDLRPGAANFLYHALAMAQLFSRPKTLARWHPGPGRWILKVLLVVPLLVQALLFIHDLTTISFGLMYKPIGTYVSLSLQALSLLGITSFIVRTFIYSLAIDRLWDSTFDYINPRWAKKAQPRWMTLIFQQPKPSSKEVVPAANGDLQPGSDRRQAVSQRKPKAK